MQCGFIWHLMKIGLWHQIGEILKNIINKISSVKNYLFDFNIYIIN